MKIFERGSLNLGVLFGIPVKIHWTFGYILAWVAYIGYSEGLGISGAMWYGLFIMVLFSCVVMHEYGHALTAKRFGIRTEDIMLTPLGGIARLARMPDKPWQELLVAIAGPLVNVAIVLLILVFIYIFPQYSWNGWDGNSLNLYLDPSKFPVAILIVNVGLVLFNLLPIFPMDGGRVLRALLAMRLTKVKATLIAARIGQVLALGLFTVGLYLGAFTLTFIGLFIFYAAYSEYRFTKTEEFFKSKQASELVSYDFSTINSGDLIQNAREQIRFTPQHIFPVSDQDYISGSLRSTDLQDTGLDPFAPILTVPLRNIFRIMGDATLMPLFRYFIDDKGDLAVVTMPDGSEGIIDKISFYKFLQKNRIIRLKTLNLEA